jgi:hypothetical protein
MVVAHRQVELKLLSEAQVISIAVKTLRKQAPAWIAAPACIAAMMVLGSVSVARGQAPACGPETAGQLSDQAGVRCECVAVAGGSITGEASGYRWDCGILRGRMNQLVPATPNAYQGPLPESIIVDPGQIPVDPVEPWQVPRHRGLR